MDGIQEFTTNENSKFSRGMERILESYPQAGRISEKIKDAEGGGDWLVQEAAYVYCAGS